jgi:predicted phage tail protein
MEFTGMKKHVVLTGFLGEKYGRDWHIVADTYKDIVSCIDANYPTFRKDLIDIANSGGDIAVEVGGNLIEEIEDMLVSISEDTVIISPVPAGSKSNTAKVVVGSLLIIASFFVPQLLPAAFGPYETLIASAALSVGANLAIIGLQNMLAPDPSVDEEQDYAFNGPENTTVSGNPVPVLCGELIVGGVTISSGTIGGFLTNDATFVEQYTGDGSSVGAGGSDIPGHIDTFAPDYWITQAEQIQRDNAILRFSGE